MVKVMFHLEPNAWHGSSTETLWASAVGPNQFKLENTPFYAFGVSYQDVVAAKQHDGNRVFVEVVRRGGHSTYRIRPNRGRKTDLDEFWRPLATAGCSYEEGPLGLLAVDVPAAANIYDVYRLLEAGEHAGVWSFEEGHCGHAVA